MPAVLSVLWMLCLMRVGPSLSCNPSISMQDLHCHLHWNCPEYNSNTPFIVQTKAQGEEWQNVSECFQISSNSCDLSQAITDIDVYNFVRLIINNEHEKIDWDKIQYCRFHQTSDARFSAPSVSVSQEGPKLLVDVAFPCAPSVLCQDEELANLSCCSISRFLSLNTTVTVYNRHNTADTQTKVFESELSRVEFGWLEVGQEYCAVAQFASSPLSEPQCIHIPQSGSLNIAALCGVIIALLLIGVCFLSRRWASSETRLPKSLMSLQNMDQTPPFVAESGLAALEEEEEYFVVLLSIVPLQNSTYGLSEPKSQSACLCSQRDEDSYYASSILHHQAFDEQDGDTGSHMETDGDAPTDHYPSDPAERTGQVCLLEDCLNPGNLGIPLSSVKVAGVQREEMEQDHLHEALINLRIVNDSQTVAGRDHAE